MQVRTVIPNHTFNKTNICAGKDIILWPTDEQVVECVRGGDHDSNSIWRPNPDFPYIYISFSYNQMVQAYYSDFYPQGAALKWGQIADTELLKHYSALIRSTIIAPTELPIKFLSSRASISEIKKKNVLFVVNHDVAVFNHDMGSALTLGFDSPARRNQHAHFMVVSIPPYNFTTFKANNLYQRIFMHEAIFHSVLEGKHPKPYYFPGDGQPYCQIGCHESLGAYETDCLTSQNDPEHYPPRLGRYDFLMVEDFKKSWKARNQAALTLEDKEKIQPQKTEKTNLENLNKALQDLEAIQQELQNLRNNLGRAKGDASTQIGFMHSTYQFLFKGLNNAFDYCIDSLQRGATNVVCSCPSYFCPDDITKKTFDSKLGETERPLRPSRAKHSLMYQTAPARCVQVVNSPAPKLC